MGRYVCMNLSLLFQRDTVSKTQNIPIQTMVFIIATKIGCFRLLWEFLQQAIIPVCNEIEHVSEKDFLILTQFIFALHNVILSQMSLHGHIAICF